MTPFSDLETCYRWLDSHVNYERNLAGIRYSSRVFELGRFARMLERLGHPHRGRRSIHIAGTRGKGSVTLALEAMLRAAGFRTAAYLSPHLHEYRERIRLDGGPLSPDGFAAHLAEAAAAREDADGGSQGFKTVFEHLTAMFFLAARGHGADWMIVETGLGGRLDATNVLDAGPVVLTRIGLEHTHLLGTTHEAIAAEKAAILKPGGFAVAGRQDESAGAMKVFEARAREVGAELVCAEDACPVHARAFGPEGMRIAYEFRGRVLDLALPLYGPFLVENLQSALAMVGELVRRGMVAEPEPGVIESALEALRLPGRMQWIGRMGLDASGPRLIADSGHCPTGGRAVAEAMRAHFQGETGCAVIGMAAEKDHDGFFRGLAEWDGWRRIICFPLNSPRSAEPERLAESAARNFGRVETAASLSEALEVAMLQAGKYANVVVAGSAYSIAEAERWEKTHGR